VNHGENLLYGRQKKEMMIFLLKAAIEKYPSHLYRYSIMGNQVSFIIEPEGGTNLSRLMQWLLSVFATRYNHHHAITGHFWHDRFKSKIMDDLRQYLTAMDNIPLYSERDTTISTGVCKDSRRIFHTVKTRGDPFVVFQFY
jgi:REP element-mobilizing transposase RayT